MAKNNLASVFEFLPPEYPYWVVLIRGNSNNSSFILGGTFEDKHKLMSALTLLSSGWENKALICPFIKLANGFKNLSKTFPKSENIAAVMSICLDLLIYFHLLYLCLFKTDCLFIYLAIYSATYLLQEVAQSQPLEPNRCRHDDGDLIVLCETRLFDTFWSLECFSRIDWWLNLIPITLSIAGDSFLCRPPACKHNIVAISSLSWITSLAISVIQVIGRVLS